MKDIVIIGAGGFAQEVTWLIEEINKEMQQWNLLGFIDSDKSIVGTEINGYKVIGDDEWLKEKDIYAVIAIGDSNIRKKIVNKLKEYKIKYPILIHPNAVYSDSVTFGEGSIICASTVFTVNINIGKFVVVNFNCNVGHGADIDDFSTILPGANISGDVKLGECTSVGTGASIIQGLSIWENSIIGAGSVVIKDIPANCTAVGSPARPIKFH